MNKTLERLAAAAKPVFRDLVGLSGLSAVVIGVDWFNRGVAIIVAGLILTALAVLLAKTG